MKKADFKHGRKVYEEGVSTPDSVYFIISGEFAVTKAIKRDANGEDD